MGLTGPDYRTQLQALLPRGAAWTRELAAIATKLLDALAEEFARVDGRAESLPAEANPATTAELLADWERVAGLPDPCTGGLEETLQGRRNALVAKLSASGSASIPYFIAVAAALGYTVTIKELKPFRIGVTPITEPLYPSEIIFVWQVWAPATTITYFTIGQSGINEPLRRWGDALLECRINQLKPAHTAVFFIYYTPLVLTDDDGEPLITDTDYGLLAE